MGSYFELWMRAFLTLAVPRCARLETFGIPLTLDRIPISPEPNDGLATLLALLVAVMAFLAKWLKVRLIPEQCLIAFVWDYVIYNSRRLYFASSLAEKT